MAHATYSLLNDGITDDEDWVLTVKDADVQNLLFALRRTININDAYVERIKADEVDDFGVLLQYEIS